MRDCVERQSGDYLLESLEQRLLLSGTGIPDGVAAEAPPSESLIEVRSDDQTAISSQSSSAYCPEAGLSGLFDCDPSEQQPERLEATQPPSQQGGDATPRRLTSGDLDRIVEEAGRRWRETGTIDDSGLRLLAGASFDIADLDGLSLGVTNGSAVQIDLDAAGHGWFVDPTPLDDQEFALVFADSLLADGRSAAAGRIDLLTVVMHELGHVIGCEHTEQAGLMAGTLEASRRLLPLSPATGSPSPPRTDLVPSPQAELTPASPRAT